ncbi:MAG TPA: gliding motility protein GldN [Edaphocola sp.]|nr:gliding motility protein GldN [Edaphocola sp.]
MNILTKVTFTFSALLLGAVSFAQNPMMNDQANTTTNNQPEAVNNLWKPTLVEDGIIDRVEHENALLPIHKIREIDIAWKATVWRVIDIKQKQNMAFRYTGDEYTGGGAFIEILNDAIKRGKIQAYSNVDDRFTTPMDMKAFDALVGGGKDTTYQVDPITGEETPVVVNKYFNVNSVTQYEVKEEWIFDRNRGRMVVQLVGIAPMKDQVNPLTGEYIGSSPMYWLYYPDLRKVLVNYEVYNSHNDMRRMSWTDFLDGHYYESYVIKTSMNNPLGSFIPDQNTLRALSQGQQELNNIIHREMDMWEE